VLSFDALADGLDPRQVVARVVAAVPAPQVAPVQREAAA
jgi:MoxR-like ATPase